MNSNKQSVILVVDDTPDNLSLMTDILSDTYKVKVASNGEKALRIAGSDAPPDLILLDIMMPGMNGYEVCRQLKADAGTQGIPVIFLTALTDLEDEKKGLELGAADYITKPVNPPIVLARIKTHLELKAVADFLRDKNTFLEEEVAKRTRQVQESEEQLRQSQKMEAVGQLAGGVAHDFNNILTVIMGYGNLLIMDAKLNQQEMEYVEQILASSEKAVQLTRGLLAFSRKQVMVPALTDLNMIVQHVHKFLLRVIGEDIQLKMVSSDKVKLPVNIDKGQIEQVLINLATNARDAMPNGGLLSIEAGMRELEQPLEHFHGSCAPGRYAWIAVSDSGTGMDEETCRRIFEPFFTTKEVGKGTGLGMSIVYGIVKQHNGFITIYSEPGKGTTFRIYIPLDENQQDQIRRDTVPSIPQGGTETILVAEDDGEVRKLVVSVLTRFGYEVIQAVDGGEAVAQFAAHQNRIGLVLMDMIMPGKNGWEASEEITRIQSGVKILYSSGYTADFLKNRGVPEEGIDVIMKPIQPMELLRKIRGKLDA
ncbi:MAG: response regulator [Desulfuromonadales bacterium]